MYIGFTCGLSGGIPLNELENQKLERLLETVQKPARYTGGEMNAVKKDWKKV